MLVSHSRGVAKKIFDTCKGIYRYRTDLSQFVLPHVVVNYVLHKSTFDASNGTLRSSHEDLVWEICCVLRGVGDIHKYKDVNDMIPSLEEFGKCIAVVERGLETHHTQGSNSAGDFTSKTSPSSGGGDHMHIQAIFALLDSLARWTSRGLMRKSRSDKTAADKRPDGHSIPDHFAECTP